MSRAPRPPVPPLELESARRNVQAAEDAWNTRDPLRVLGAYSVDSMWWNRGEVLQGHGEIIEFLRRKWERELDYALRKGLWTYGDDRIAVRFQYEWRDADGRHFRAFVTTSTRNRSSTVCGQTVVFADRHSDQARCPRTPGVRAAWQRPPGEPSVVVVR